MIRHEATEGRLTNSAITGVGHINGEGPWPCQLRVDVERIDVSTNLPKADAGWSFVDSLGHFHAYNQAADGQGERYPTLHTRVEEIPCSDPDHDADCDGRNIIHWLCAICAEEVRPGTIPGPYREYLDGPRTWEAKVQVPAERAFQLAKASDKVILHVVNGNGHAAFGVGVVLGNFTYTSGDTSVALTIACAGPLGTRRAA